MNLDERFKSLPAIVNQSCSQTSTDNTAAVVKGTTVEVPNKPPSGLAYRFKVAGTKTGTNAAHTVILQVGATAIMTLTADDATAVDWVAEFTIIFSSSKTQKVMGVMSSNTTDCEADYAAGTVDCTPGATMKVVVAAGHASDTVTSEIATVEQWQLDLATS